MKVEWAYSFNTPEGVEGFSRNTDIARVLLAGMFVGFNTPEGVEGFSRPPGGEGGERRCVEGFNTPEGVEGFSRAQALAEGRVEGRNEGQVSIPRRVLRGFRGSIFGCRGTCITQLRFQYPGGC